MHLGSACVTRQAATVFAMTVSISLKSWIPRTEVRMTPPFAAIRRPVDSQMYFAACNNNHTHRVVFVWVSDGNCICFGFALLHSVIGQQNWHHFLNQWKPIPKPITAYMRTFSRTLQWLYVITFNPFPRKSDFLAFTLATARGDFTRQRETP